MKKLLVLLTAMALITGLLTGCGGKEQTTTSGHDSSKLKEITISEMFASQMKENDGNVYMFTQIMCGDYSIDSQIAAGELRPRCFFAYDGSVLTEMNDDKLPDSFNETLSNVSSLDVVESISAQLYRGTFDDTIEYEALLFIKEDGTMRGYTSSRRLYSNESTSYHVTIEGDSYMVLDNHDRNYDGDNTYIIIKDTDYTKDKVVIFDTADSSKSIAIDSDEVTTPIIIK